MENWRRNVWVGGSSPFFANDDFLTTQEFEHALQKKEETLEHYGNQLVFFCQASSCIIIIILFDDDAITFFREGALQKKTIFFVA